MLSAAVPISVIYPWQVLRYDSCLLLSIIHASVIPRISSILTYNLEACDFVQTELPIVTEIEVDLLTILQCYGCVNGVHIALKVHGVVFHTPLL